MQIPLEISFQHVRPEEEIKAYVHERVDSLGKLHDGITSCQVYIAAPQNRQTQGHLYDITIEVRVPGKDLVVSDRKNDLKQHQHLRIALIEQDLKIYKQKMRGKVKVLDGKLQGNLAELHHAEGYGQILATDHRLIYFHRNAVLGRKFDTMQVGDTVELVARHDESAVGPQASTVRAIGALRFRP
ncbi:MAG: HPF/RaiA family ribosome-associated protein [Paracoccaceae bacterium]|jgi:ribosome-associated translation inhibitor RaiA